MAEQPNQSMDARLRDYARRRRGRAEEEGGMPVGMRRFLMAEVGRRWRRVEGSGEERRFWFYWWGPRLAWSASVLALVGLVTLVLRTQPGGESGTARSEGEIDGKRARGEGLVRGVVPGPVGGQGVMVGGRTQAGPAGGVQEAVTESVTAAPRRAPTPAALPAPLAVAPTPKAEVEHGLASRAGRDAAVQGVERQRAAGADAGVAGGRGSVAMGGAPAVRGMPLATGVAGEAAVRFARVEGNAALPRRETRSGGFVVLSVFDVVGLGDRVRVVDADGSVYVGERMPASGTVGVVKPAGASGAGEGGKATGPVEAGAFRVVGTNVTLGERVEFTGLLRRAEVVGARPTLGSSAGGSGGGGPTADGGGVASGAGQILLEGRVVVGGGGRVDVRARSISGR